MQTVRNAISKTCILMPHISPLSFIQWCVLMLIHNTSHFILSLELLSTEPLIAKFPGAPKHYTHRISGVIYIPLTLTWLTHINEIDYELVVHHVEPALGAQNCVAKVETEHRVSNVKGCLSNRDHRSLVTRRLPFIPFIPSEFNLWQLQFNILHW